MIRIQYLVGACGVLGLFGCRELTGSQSLPAGTPSPGSYNTPSGAVQMRNAALALLEQTLNIYVIETGTLADELESNRTGASPGVLSARGGLSVVGSLDERILPEQNGQLSSNEASGSYPRLQQVRGSIAQALGALAAYDSGAAQQGDPAALRGELFALEGYTEILLAEFYCSGVPLSTLDFQHDFTYQASSNTVQVENDAIAKEDSALQLAGDSVHIANLALVLKGRALLDLGQYAKAAQIVVTVPDTFRYQLATQWIVSGSNVPTGFNYQNGKDVTVSNNEGVNGLHFVTDPRTAVDTLAPITPLYNSTPELFPKKYQDALNGAGGFSAFVVADGIEARLIEAEAAYHAGDTAQMIVKLNHLRETATVPGQSGSLADVPDPGSDTAAVSLLFRERAYWLFLTGHRQGDLRRLVRQYGRSQSTVYPTGPYDAPGAGVYGTDVTAPIPAAEYQNPLFHGCLDRNA